MALGDTGLWELLRGWLKAPVRVTPEGLMHRVDVGLCGQFVRFGEHMCCHQQWRLHPCVCPCVTIPCD